MASNTVLAKLAVVISANAAEFNAQMKQSTRAVNGFANTLKGGLAAVGIGFGLDQLASFGKEVIKITAEFQKFEAVLTNTLGSSSAAQIALKQIQEFAAKTPFSVQELTSSFVKLANMGFKPTIQEMTRLGDLSSSVGKSFDQLTEAIIDAQTGEFERLKEFGIRASKEGDRVTFAFKGVKTQVDFTGESIRKYILSLGELQGVQGGMAAISETLGGKISNLGDSWDTLLKTLGEGNSGVLSGTVDLLGEALAVATDLLKTTKQRNDEEKLILSDAVLSKYKAFGTEQEKQDFRNKLWQRLYDLQLQNTKALKDWANTNYAEYQQRVKDIEVLKQSLGLIGDIIKSTKDEADAKAELVAKGLETERMAREKANAQRLEEINLSKQIADINRRLTGRADPATNALGTTIDIAPALERAKAQMKQFTDAFRSFKAESDMLVLDLGSNVSGAISDIAMLIGQAFVGGEDFGKSFLKILANFCAQVGAAAIALGITMLNLRAAFATPGAAIAAGVALLAIAGALGAASKAQDNFNRGSSSSSTSAVSASNAGRVTRSDNQIILNPELVVSGANLKLVLKNQDRIDNRTGPK